MRKLLVFSDLVITPLHSLIAIFYSSDWMLMITLFGSFGLLIALFVKRRETPTNLILLAAFVRKKIYFF